VYVYKERLCDFVISCFSNQISKVLFDVKYGCLGYKGEVLASCAVHLAVSTGKKIEQIQRDICPSS